MWLCRRTWAFANGLDPHGHIPEQEGKANRAGPELSISTCCALLCQSLDSTRRLSRFNNLPDVVVDMAPRNPSKNLEQVSDLTTHNEDASPPGNHVERKYMGSIADQREMQVLGRSQELRVRASEATSIVQATDNA